MPANGWVFSGTEWGAADAPTVLLLHGFPQTSDSWRAVAVRLADAGLHPVALDQRGYSPGARPSDVAAYALPELVADAAAMIESLGAPVHLAGHDWGAVVGWQVAARRPELVSSWTAVSTPNQLALLEAFSTDVDQRGAFGYMAQLRQPGFSVPLLANDARELCRIFGGVVSEERMARDVAVLSEPGVLELALNWYRAMSPSDATGLPRISVPTSYVWGSKDMAFKRTAAELTGNYVDADYTFVPLEDATHWLPDEAVETLADVITRRVLGE